ncbi:MAG: hypothetical protein WC840_00165 [Candidatus Peribacteraceae bacterium]
MGSVGKVLEKFDPYHGVRCFLSASRSKKGGVATVKKWFIDMVCLPSFLAGNGTDALDIACMKFLLGTPDPAVIVPSCPLP